jgi:hypothetical protein
MATVQDIVRAAYRKIGIVSTGENMPADYAEDGLFTFNAMLHGWKARSVDVEHTDLDLTDDFPLDAQFIEGTVYVLASRLSPDFQTPQQFDADDWFRTLQAAYATVPALTVPAAVLRPPSREDREGNLPAITSP